MFTRKQTKVVNIGNVAIGGGNRIAIQSMTNTKTHDVKSTVSQIKSLEELGCDIIRVAVANMEDANAIAEIKKEISIPLVADIHFDYRLAIAAINSGADKIRLNPGNIGGEENVKTVATLAKERAIPIRIGVNGGSLEREILNEFGSPCPEAIVKSAMVHINMLKNYNFDDIVISLKTSDVNDTIEAYKLFAKNSDIPLHLGVTEAGGNFAGVVKSAVGIGSMLSLGLGDTIRVSLTGSPLEEIKTAKQILKSLKLIEKGVEIVSCPTCGRCNVNLAAIADEVADKTAGIDKNITIAVMGCAVNGPGEAREADIGVACGKNEGLIFKKGEIIKKVKETEIVEELLRMIDGI